MIPRTAYKEVFDDTFEQPRERIPLTLTKPQRRWILNMYSTIYNVPEDQFICMMPVVRDEQFVLCGLSDGVHAHHIFPKGHAYWSAMEDKVDINHPANIITLCPCCHVGKGYKGSLDHHNEFVPVIHPDIAWANRNYYPNKDSFEKVFEGRKDLTDEGEIYWNEDFDIALAQKAEETYFRYCNYLSANGVDDPYPSSQYCVS